MGGLVITLKSGEQVDIDGGNIVVTPFRLSASRVKLRFETKDKSARIIRLPKTSGGDNNKSTD